MSAIVFKVNRKSGALIKASVAPANHSEEPHFGLADGLIVAFLLASAGSLICLLLFSLRT
jgi:hypothetical protein